MNKYYGLAAVLLGLTAWFSVGHHQGDEHFQILEFAGYKLGIAQRSDLAWEYGERMRPALQPAMAYLVYKVLGAGERADPFGVALLLRLLSATYTLGVAYLLFRRFRPEVTTDLRWLFVIVVFFHWCAYYNGVRFSSENWSGLTATLGFLLYPLEATGGGRVFTPPRGGRKWGGAFLSGVCFGLAFLFRYQIALLVAGFGLWLLFVYRETWRRMLAVIAGGLLILLIAYPLTYWLYGEWTLPAWNYLASNLIEGKAATFGTRPWYGYFELVFLRGIPPLGLVYVVATVGYCAVYRRDPVSWMVATFVIVHSLLARKDVRFLFPLLPLLPVMIVGFVHALRGTYDVSERTTHFLRYFGILCIVVNFILLASVMVRPAHSGLKVARYLYDRYPDQLLITGPQAKLFHAEDTSPRFYSRAGYRQVQVAGTDVKPEVDSLPYPRVYVTRGGTVSLPVTGAVLLYTDRPDWIETVNLFGWADRVGWWQVYALP